MQSNMDELEMGTHVHIKTSTGVRLGLVAQTLPNHHVLVLATSGGHFIISPREDIREIPENTRYGESEAVRRKNELRERMGLPVDKVTSPTELRREQD